MKLLWVVLAVGVATSQTVYPKLSDGDKVSAEIVTEPVDDDLKDQVIRLKNPLDWLKDVKNDIKEDIQDLFHGSGKSDDEEEVNRHFGFTRSHEFKNDKGLQNGLPWEKERDSHPKPTKAPKTPFSHPFDMKPHPDFKPIDYTPLKDKKAIDNEVPHKKNHPEFKPIDIKPIDNPMVNPRPPFDNIPADRSGEENTDKFNCVCKPKMVRGRPQGFFTNLDCNCKDSKGENQSLEDKIHEDKKKAEQNGWKRVLDWIKKVKEFKHKEEEALRRWREGKEHKELEREQRERGTTPKYHWHDDEETCDNPSHKHLIKKDEKKQKKSKKHDDDSDSSSNSSSEESAEKKHKKDKKEKKEKKEKKNKKGKKEKGHTNPTRKHRISTHAHSTVQPTSVQPTTLQPTTEEPTTLVPTGSTHGPTTTVVERILK